MPMPEPDKVQRTYEGKEAGASGEFVRSFYIRRILHPLFMFQVRHLPLFFDFAYYYIMALQHQVHGAMMKPDWIEKARIELSQKRQ